MCRNIKTLHHFAPPASEEEILASSLQYVRKLSGMQRPSRANQEAFWRAVHKVREATAELLAELETHGPPRDREIERLKAVERGRKREERYRSSG
jgi:hypothetical protein